MRVGILVVCALIACKKADTAATSAAGSGSGSAPAKMLAAANDPWNVAPPGADTKLGERSKGISSAKAAAPTSGLARKVDVSAIEKATPQAPISGFGAVKESGFRVIYNPSKSEAHEQYRKVFAENHVFEKVAEGLNSTVRLPITVDINTVDCNTVNAFYDPTTKRIIVCYELIDYFLETFRPHVQDENALGNAVMGAVMFSFFHESGHGLIDILDLAAVGREEDSVDQLATLILIAAGDEGVSMALSGSHYFKTQQEAGSKMPFSDEHAFDGQRFYNINCLIYGSNPEKYAGFMRAGELTEERAARCPEEYRKIKKAWEKLLEPFMTNGAAANVDYKPSVPVAEAPKSTTSDPWDTDGVPTPAKTPEQAPDTPTPTPAAPEHAVSCEQVAMKAIELIGAAAEEQAKQMTAAQIEELKRRLESELPATAQQVIAQCAKDNWSDTSRKCVLDADTLAAAEKCN